jgi:hypothetical protein
MHPGLIRNSVPARPCSDFAAPECSLQGQLVFDHRHAIHHLQAARGAGLHELGTTGGDNVEHGAIIRQSCGIHRQGVRLAKPERGGVDQEAGVVEFFVQADFEICETAAEFCGQDFDWARRFVQDPQPL